MSHDAVDANWISCRPFSALLRMELRHSADSVFLFSGYGTLQEEHLEESTPLFSRKNRVLNSPIPAMSTGTISTDDRGVDLVVDWTIPHFFALESEGAGYRSPPFSFADEEWWLRIFPNGWSGRDSSGYLDLFLVKVSPGPSIRQFFSISLKTVKGNKYNEQHGTRNFDDDNSCHPFIRFIPRTELTTRRPELVPVDVLTVVCTMKGLTSAGSDSKSFQDNHKYYIKKSIYAFFYICEFLILFLKMFCLWNRRSIYNKTIS